MRPTTSTRTPCARRSPGWRRLFPTWDSPRMRDAVICEPVRTPVGRFGGVFKNLSAVKLGAAAIAELVRRTALPAEAIDDVLLGQCYPNGEEPALGRVAALDAGLPVEVPGLQLDR